MRLGTYTFLREPSAMPVLTADRISASIMTYSGVAFFSLGSDIVGKTVRLSWPAMPPEMFEDLEEIRDADESVEWDPETESGVFYSVQITDLAGEYWITQTDAEWRQNVKLDLLITGEISS